MNKKLLTVISFLLLSLLIGFIAGTEYRTGNPVVNKFGETYVDNKTITNFESLWFKSVDSQMEEVLCLEVRNDVITGSYPATINDNGFDYVKFTCLGNNAFAHTHPSGNCVASPADYYRAGYSKMDFFVVICGEKDFYIYDMTNHGDAAKVVII